MKIIGIFKRFFLEETAQVTVEYVLTLTIMIGAMAYLFIEFQGYIKVFWQALIDKISRGCPTC